jgi:arabinofuranan 3-O-arabinosyltransferase
VEPRAGAPQALTSASRVRLAAACLLVVGLALVQDPGFLVPDTKFDLVEAPIDFLGRALHLWDAQGASGQLQNQAYGYLWPMGPFFALGVSLLPGWVVQRLWLGLVMAVALSGTVKVCKAIGVRSDLACLTAGFAFALSPRMLTTLGPISIEAWPSALAPWVLLPLIHGSRAGSPRRWAALSGLAVATVGGVNAAAAFAVIPLGVVWLLTRTPGPRRRALMLWWPMFTVLGTLWWVIPLFVMGRYSPPFLDFIETTTVTTFPTTLFDVLRGTSNWVPYLDSGSRAGNDLITTPYLVLNSGVVLMVGLAGLVHRRTPERGFLALSVLLGTLMVAAGHSGAVEGWFAADIRTLLDGVLAPLRNVHKFDVILRLPLVIGLAAVIDRVLADRSDRDRGPGRPFTAQLAARGNQLALVGMVLAAVAGSVLPAFLGRITPAGAMIDVPQYWQQTADWLGDHDSGDGTAMLVPGAQFASYVWGAPRDEPLQFYADSPWAVRNVIPLTPPANIRMLDEIERRLVQGDGSPGLTAYLRRAGVQYVVVRNDLPLGNDVPLPVVVHQSLDRAGLTRVASFGPDIGGGATLEGGGVDRVVVNGGWQAVYPAVEIFEVPGDTDRAVAAGEPPVVVGGPEDLADLADLDLLGDSPTRLATDLDDKELDEQPDAPVILTDGLRARERFFARIHDGYSSVLTPGDVRRSGNPARDYLIDSGDRWSTTGRLVGARTLSASSSQSDADALGGSERGQLPFAAVDRSLATEWVTGLGRDEQSWWQLDLVDPVPVATVTVTGGASAPDNQEVRVVTEAGASDPVEIGPDQTAVVSVPAGDSGWVRVEDSSGSPGRRLALAEVAVPGVRVERQLVLPELPPAWDAPDVVVLRDDHDARSGCVEVGPDVRCVEDRVRTSEEPRVMSRVVRLPAAAAYEPELRVRPQAGRALDKVMLRGQPLRISASSEAVPDPRASAVAAVDGDPGTSWLAAADDLRPTLSLRWLGEERITGISLDIDAATAARLPARLRLTWPGGTQDVDLVDGSATFAPIVTDQLQIRVEQADGTVDLGFDAEPAEVGIGVGELELHGLPYLPLGLSEDARSSGCGIGPAVELGGRTYQTFVDASPAALLRGETVDAQLCDEGSDRPRALPIDNAVLGSGENVVTVTGSRAFAPDTVVLRRSSTDLRSGTEPATESGDAVTRRVVTPPGADVVELRQNTNAGWTARQGDSRLDPVVLDGWKQGWQLHDDQPVVAEFSPDRPYRTGLLVGLVAVLVLAGLTILLLLRRGRDREGPPGLRDRLLSRWVAVPAAVAGAGLTAGWTGVAIAAAVGLVAVVVDRRWPETWQALAPWLFGAPAFAVSVWYAVRPWGNPTGWAGQDAWTAYAMVVSLVGLVLLAAGRGRLHTPFRRSAGRSSSR